MQVHHRHGKLHVRPRKKQEAWCVGESKTLQPVRSGTTALKDGNLVYSDPRTKANILNKQFASVFNNEDDSDLPDLNSSPYPTMDNIEVSTEDVA